MRLTSRICIHYTHIHSHTHTHTHKASVQKADQHKHQTCTKGRCSTFPALPSIAQCTVKTCTQNKPYRLEQIIQSTIVIQGHPRLIKWRRSTSRFSTVGHIHTGHIIQSTIVIQGHSRLTKWRRSTSRFSTVPQLAKASSCSLGQCLNSRRCSWHTCVCK